MPTGNVGGGSKAVIENRALLNRVRDTNHDANSANIDKMAAIESPKKEVGIWPVLVIIITGKKLTKVLIFIIVFTVNISSIFISIVSQA